MSAEKRVRQVALFLFVLVFYTESVCDGGGEWTRRYARRSETRVLRVIDYYER